MQQVLDNPSKPGAAAQPLDQERILAIIAGQKNLAGPMLPVLHAIQDALGYIPAEAVPLIASELNLSRAEVHGVISYYHYFRQHPAGRHVVQICRAEACQARGCDALVGDAPGARGWGGSGSTAE